MKIFPFPGGSSAGLTSLVQFFQFLIHQLGNHDTEEDILKAFLLFDTNEVIIHFQIYLFLLFDFITKVNWKGVVKVYRKTFLGPVIALLH